VAASLGGGILSKFLPPGQTQLTPDQASQLSPAQVTEIASHAEQAKPSVVDQVGSFYAQHLGLIKTLGGVALTTVSVLPTDGISAKTEIPKATPIMKTMTTMSIHRVRIFLI
jgi:hypothetical protein